MKTISLNAYAKINLFLDVTSKRPDGYHNIDSVMQAITLCDVVKVDLAYDTVAKNIHQSFIGAELACDESNLCYKAASAYLKYYNIESYDIRISVEKRIPLAAGLAGGSSDAAAVIRALDILYDKNSSPETLCEIGLKVGSDVPFCIISGICAVTGRGENVRSLAPLGDMYVVVAKSKNESVSTKKAYALIDSNENDAYSHANFDEYVKAVQRSDINAICGGVYNIFQTVMRDELTETYELIELLKKEGAACAMMSGSGPSVFAVFKKRQAAERAAVKLSQRYFAELCEFV